MNPESKIYIAGHRGLVGTALMRNLREKGFENFLTRTHAELDLTSQAAVDAFFESEKPDYVFLAAAKVGGIHANNTYPAEFIRDNLTIQTNIIHAAYKNNVKRLLFLGSSCIYPKLAPQPMKEEHLLTSELEPTNRPYALAKIAGIEMCWAYNRQYKTQYLAVMPTNLYGPGDNYHPENSHVIPALIRRFHEAKLANAPNVTVWGTGTPRREFLYSDDMADACVYLMSLPDEQFVPLLGQDRNDGLAPLMNIGVGHDLTIRELAETVKDVVGYQGMIEFDSTKPDGTPRKLMDVGRLNAMGWSAHMEMREGLARAYQDFLGGLQPVPAIRSKSTA
ncbi:MAG: GDP-fucose synthetase [Thiobacillus sp. SCN 63-57]|uniref:GDP-L-fucose synthase family protein n=1 Tax=Thiobacillus sp. SCN 63-57 TaxID=1660145 RepID=UPI00086E595D|nr:GDP-L-fucose synthase [Thiobacillus sp. SCN 63-57]ODU99301.1 MAG: GDP-fucose synthetase [Thiobacillus sp. SCN 63-57]